MVLAEAMAHHLPIIASDLPVVIELLANTNNNYIFENGNIYDMAEKIEMFINASNYEEMSEQSYILSKYLSVCSIINQWNLLLSNLSA